MSDCCSIFIFSLFGSLCCFCMCICTKNKIYNDFCPFECCSPSAVSNMPTALINQQPGLNNLDGLDGLDRLDGLDGLDGVYNLPKYDEIDDNIIINELISTNELPPPEYIP